MASGVQEYEKTTSLTEHYLAEAGRVLAIELDADGPVAGVRILSQPGHGHVSVNPDNSLSLVLSEDPQNETDTGFHYEITYADGRVQEVEAQVDVTAGKQEQGWGLGQVYMLEQDADGRVVVEHGDNHRKVHVTEGDHGLTAADIAKAEGLQAKDITAAWLIKHPEYGATPDKALASELGMELWYKITSKAAGPTSHWLLFERGYEYDDTGRLITRGSQGESALNPIFIGAYGQGVDPKITDPVQLFQEDSNHVVLQGLDIGEFMALEGNNLLLDHISITGEGELNVQGVNGFTLRDSDITDVVRQSPANTGSIWEAHVSRISGAYIANTKGLLLEGNLIDRNGWGEGYDVNLSANAPQPPSMYSHNLYLQADNLDVTLRDNIIMRGASFGAQVRSGGLIEGNSFIDNNAALNFLGGNYEGAGPVGNYTLLLDNLVTSAGYKRVSKFEGALSMGIDGGVSVQSSYIGNVIAHLADPNNPQEQAEKTVIHGAFMAGQSPYFDDTIVYNWGNPDHNVSGLSKFVLDETTIQNFTAQLLGTKTATISDLADYLRAQASGRLDNMVDADVINAFFRKGFGLDTTLRDAAETLRFTPDNRADGIRWDNRLNWSTGDLPGTQDGDSVDLGGNRVLFGAKTVSIDDFIFGHFGQLKTTSGRLNIDGNVSTSRTGNLLQVDNAGQVWVDGYRDSDLLEIELTGGRFANKGIFAGETRISASDDAQLLLATAGARFDLASGSNLTITGAKAKVGFDGSNGKAATLQLHDGATLSFVADATGLGKITEFHSGAFKGSSSVNSEIRLDGTLSIDLSNYINTKSSTWTLIDADYITGSFDNIQIFGLSGYQNASLHVDYTLDKVCISIEPGSGAVSSTIIGDDGAYLSRLNVFGYTAVNLNSGGVLNQETNLGNLIADANLAYAKQYDASVAVSIANGRSITASIGNSEDDSISQYDIQAALAFNNDLSLITVTRANLVQVLEHAVAQAPTAAGQFVQVSGIQYSFDPSQPPGSRIISAAITDAHGKDIDVLVRDGKIVGNADGKVRIVTPDFMADGSDGYPFSPDLTDRVNLADLDNDGVADALRDGAADFANSGSEQDAFAEYLAEFFAASDSAYDVVDTSYGGDDRIQNLAFRDDTVIDEADVNIVMGTTGRDRLEGTQGNDLLIGAGGNMDQLTGGTGADVFLFGSETLDGVRIRSNVMDYEVGVDRIALTEGVAVASLQQAGNTVVAYLDDPTGLDDAIYIRGVGVSIDNISFLNDYFIVGA